MIIIRPITIKDLDIFLEFSFDATLGIRNLPRDRETLYKRVQTSEASFAKKIQKPGKDEYLFVLEDLSKKKIGGVSGIFSNISHYHSYAFRLESIETKSKHVCAAKETLMLKLIKNKKKLSEICSLYLQPAFRHSGNGKLLSLSRFLFIAGHRNRFEKKIIAEMRGYIDENQISPFWNAVGRHFCHLSFVELMTHIDKKTISISDILPRYPIYVDLLPEAARQAIGQTHEMTKPAMHLLLQEGFTFKKEIDVLEAGPNLEASTASIRTIKNSRLTRISLIDQESKEGSQYLLSNDHLDFRACYGHLRIDLKKNFACIDPETADALNVKNGQSIRYVSLY